MKLYFASLESRTKSQLPLLTAIKKALVSYHYINQKNIQPIFDLNIELFLDSGAFSSFTQKTKINIDNYCNFIKTNENKFTVYAGLDVIGDYIETYNNIQYMEAKYKLKPLPTFHYGSPYSHLKFLVENYDYIALGGLVPYAKQKKLLFNHLDKCFSIIKNKIKIHGFGMNGFDTLKRYPFYSVDATTWLRGSLAGEIYTFKNGKFESNYFANKDIKYFNNSDYKQRDVNNVIEFLKMEKFITELWQKRGIIWND